MFYSIVFHILIILVGYGIFKFVELNGLGSLNIGFVYVGFLENNLYLLSLILILLSVILFTVIFVVILSLLGLYKKRITTF
ncbi:hypothetical protein C8K15_13810 [Paenisporosarcina sp. OV554]|nr:hypothetical protein C8K15_13810 [Paenisporosarcina sp. OV554]